MAQDQVSQRRVTTSELESLRNLVGSTRAMVEQHGRRLVEVKEGVLQPVICYAAPHWDDHFAAAVSLLQDETTHYGICCAEVRWYLKRRTMDEFPLSYGGALDEAPTAASTPLSVVDSPPLRESPDTAFESSGDVAATGITIRSLNREHQVKKDDPTPAGRINHAGPAVRDLDAVSGVGHPRGALDVDTNFQNLVTLSHGPNQNLNQLEGKGAGEAAKSPIAVQRHPERTAALERHDQPPERSALPGTTQPLRYVEGRKTRSLRDVGPLELLQPKEPTGIVDSPRKVHKDPVSVGEQSMLHASVNPPVPQPTTAAQFSNHRPSQNAPTRPTDRGGKARPEGTANTGASMRLQQDLNLMDVVPPPPDLDLERRTMNAMLNTNTPSQQPAPPTVSLLPNIVPSSPQEPPKRQSYANPKNLSAIVLLLSDRHQLVNFHQRQSLLTANLSPTTYTPDNRDTRFRNEPQPQPGLDSAQFPNLHDDDQSQDGSERSESVAWGDTPAQKAKRGLLRRALRKTAKRVDEVSKKLRRV
ncbi:hypothetical protein QC762_510920 [Podospora pseudocomata]|uniref:Uncharacterized protein n=1 Tax=Podospora pseudocomata TaxID=2093779 RepID=A0ABR0GDU9_9PEZI|nr:hypothetical protein QC762_510920 [Podospora pseudocomata]